jgi:hypothetical protein
MKTVISIFSKTFLFSMFISKKKKSPPPHIYRTFTARTHTCGCSVDLPHVRLFGAASLVNTPHIHWVARGTGTPKNRDEVNRRDVSECDG